MRTVRLAALADSPTAFGSTLEREQKYDEARWRDWTRNVATFLACCNGLLVGIAGGLPGSNTDERTVVAMWVQPDHRRIGVASALLDTLRRWARDDGATRLTLWVTRSNDPAATLYGRAGYTPTGDSKPLPSNPSLVEDKLSLELR